MPRMRFTSRPEGGPIARFEEEPSGRLQFRTPEEAALAAADARRRAAIARGETPRAPQQEPMLDEGVHDFVGDRIAQATEPGEAAGGLDVSALEAEYEALGRLSDESYSLLAGAGIPRRVVDAYIDGQIARGEQLTREAHDIAGGEQRFKAALAWGRDNLPPEQLRAYQEAVETSPDRARFAVQGLCAAHQKATGVAPQLTRGEPAPAPDGVFRSAQDVSAAIRDPRYKKDPAYRAQVAARLAKSSIF
ncbi:MAG: hypothetical protein AAF909_06635 [Pseudomonadota bacterium]